MPSVHVLQHLKHVRALIINVRDALATSRKLFSSYPVELEIWAEPEDGGRGSGPHSWLWIALEILKGPPSKSNWAP